MTWDEDIMTDCLVSTEHFAESITYDGGSAISAQADPLENLDVGGEKRKVRQFHIRVEDIAEPVARDPIIYDSETYYVHGDGWKEEAGIYSVWTYKKERRSTL